MLSHHASTWLPAADGAAIALPPSTVDKVVRSIFNMSSSSPTDSTVVYALAIRQQCLSSGQVVLVRDAAPVVYSLAPPSNLPVRSIAAPASSFHAWLSVTERQAWQSVPRGTGLASHRHLGHTATQPSRHPSALASTLLTCGVLHSH